MQFTTNNFHFHLGSGCDRALVEAVVNAVNNTLETKMLPLIQTLKDKTDGLIAHVDAMDTKLQEVKQQLADLLANGGLSTEDTAAVEAIIAKLDAEDTKVVADT